MIYVDQLAYKKPNGKKFYCHLFADTLEELHSFAELIGRKRCWFHRSLGGYNHYDLDSNFRNLAVNAGAMEIDTKDAIMAKKLSRTIETYLANEGWSSRLFLEHAKHAFEHLKETKVSIGRTVIYITNGKKLIKAYVHFQGRSEEYVTFTNALGNELVTVHHTMTPEEFLDTIKKLLEDE